MLATFRTIRWSIDSASTKAARSAAMRSTACRAVWAGLASPQLPELRDRARPRNACRGGPGPSPRQLVLARGEPAGLEDARVAPEFLGRFGERGLADVVAADDEITGLGERQAFEQRQLGDEPCAVGQASCHRGQTHA